MRNVVLLPIIDDLAFTIYSVYYLSMLYRTFALLNQ